VLIYDFFVGDVLHARLKKHEEAEPDRTFGEE